MTTLEDRLAIFNGLAESYAAHRGVSIEVAKAVVNRLIGAEAKELLEQAQRVEDAVDRELAADAADIQRRAGCP